MTDQFSKEVAEGNRFEFGNNWKAFLSVLDDERIHEAEKSLHDMLEISELTGKSFLDIGSGSGLFSLAARRMGAKVHSFEVATPDEVFEFFKKRDFLLVKLKTCGGTHALNEFVFEKKWQ